MNKIRLKNCKLRIRHIKKLGKNGDEFGEFLEMTNKKFKTFFDIKLSLRQNKRPSVYLRTLIHELLHFAFEIIKLVYKKKVTGRAEHDFIERIEDSVLANLHLLKFDKRMKDQ